MGQDLPKSAESSTPPASGSGLGALAKKRKRRKKHKAVEHHEFDDELERESPMRHTRHSSHTHRRPMSRSVSMHDMHITGASPKKKSSGGRKWWQQSSKKKKKPKRVSSDSLISSVASSSSKTTSRALSSDLPTETGALGAAIKMAPMTVGRQRAGAEPSTRLSTVTKKRKRKGARKVRFVDDSEVSSAPVLSADSESWDGSSGGSPAFGFGRAKTDLDAIDDDETRERLSPIWRPTTSPGHTGTASASRLPELDLGDSAKLHATKSTGAVLIGGGSAAARGLVAIGRGSKSKTKLKRSITVGIEDSMSKKDLMRLSKKSLFTTARSFEEQAFKRELHSVLDSLNTFEEQLPLNDQILLRILSFTKPLEQLHLCLVSKELRYFVYYRKLIPGLKHHTSIKYYYDKYSVYYDLRRKSFKFNLTDSLDVPSKCRLKTKGDKKRLILFLLFQSQMARKSYKAKVRKGSSMNLRRLPQTPGPRTSHSRGFFLERTASATVARHSGDTEEEEEENMSDEDFMAKSRRSRPLKLKLKAKAKIVKQSSTAETPGVMARASESDECGGSGSDYADVDEAKLSGELSAIGSGTVVPKTRLRKSSSMGSKRMTASVADDTLHNMTKAPELPPLVMPLKASVTPLSTGAKQRAAAKKPQLLSKSLHSTVALAKKTKKVKKRGKRESILKHEAKLLIGTASKKSLDTTRAQFRDNFQQTFASLDRLEVAWLTYGRKRPLSWLESILVSPFCMITRLDFSGSILTEKSLNGMFNTLQKRLGPSPITDLNFMGNRKLNDKTIAVLLECVSKKMPYLKTLYMDYTGLSDGACERFYELYRDCEYLSEKRSALKALSAGLPKSMKRTSRKLTDDSICLVEDTKTDEASEIEKPVIRLKKISMEGTKVNVAGVRHLNRIYKEALVSEKDTVSFYTRIDWSLVAKTERVALKKECDSRIKFY